MAMAIPVASQQTCLHSSSLNSGTTTEDHKCSRVSGVSLITVNSCKWQVSATTVHELISWLYMALACMHVCADCDAARLQTSAVGPQNSVYKIVK